MEFWLRTLFELFVVSDADRGEVSSAGCVVSTHVRCS